jgi:hypothetical protein
MNLYAGVEVELHAFLTLAPDRREWSASCLPVPTKQEAGSAPESL